MVLFGWQVWQNRFKNERIRALLMCLLHTRFKICNLGCVLLKQILHILPEHLSLPPFFCGIHVFHLFFFFSVVSVLLSCPCSPEFVSACRFHLFQIYPIGISLLHLLCEKYSTWLNHNAMYISCFHDILLNNLSY